MAVTRSTKVKQIQKKKEKKIKYIPADRIRLVIVRCPFIEKVSKEKRSEKEEENGPKNDAPKSNVESKNQPKPTFDLGDIVLVKWRQFPDWPALITHVEEKVNAKSTSTYFHVEFFPKRDT